MKKYLVLIVCLSLVVSCQPEVKDFVTLKGKIKSSNIKSLTLQGNKVKKEIKIGDDGAFLDTLKVSPGIFVLFNGGDRTTIFLKNGFDLKLDFQGENIGDGIEYSGNGSDSNNFLEKKRTILNNDFSTPKDFFKLDKTDFDSKILNSKKMFSNLREKSGKLDSLVISIDLNNDEMFFSYLERGFNKYQKNMVLFAKGKPSPIFKNYENSNGGKTSLEELKGKYVYINIWTTWSAPCKNEISFMNELEIKYKGENIEFVSISLNTPDMYKNWKEMVVEKKMTGIQLIADADFNSEFIKEYGINNVPRYILIDPKGNIVNADTFKPSDTKLKDLFSELGI